MVIQSDCQVEHGFYQTEGLESSMGGVSLLMFVKILGHLRRGHQLD